MSSSFTEETVRKVANLARLQLTDDEVVRFTAQLGNILKYIDKLNSLDTSKIEPLMTPVTLETPLRADEVRPGPGASMMLESAPEQSYENYKVPQVLGGGQ